MKIIKSATLVAMTVYVLLAAWMPLETSATKQNFTSSSSSKPQPVVLGEQPRPMRGKRETDTCAANGQAGHTVGRVIGCIFSLGISCIITENASVPDEEWQRVRREHAKVLKEHEPHYGPEEILMSFDCSNVEACKSSVLRMNNLIKSETNTVNVELGGTKNSVIGSVKDFFVHASYSHSWTHATTEQTQVSQEFTPIVPSSGSIVMRKRLVDVDVRVPPMWCAKCGTPHTLYCVESDRPDLKPIYQTLTYPAKGSNEYSIKYDYNENALNPTFYNSKPGFEYPTTNDCQQFKAASPSFCAYHIQNSARSKASIAVWRSDQSCAVCEADKGGATYDSQGRHLFRGRLNGSQQNSSKLTDSVSVATGWLDEELCHFVVKVPRTKPQQFRCIQLAPDRLSSKTVVIAPFDNSRSNFEKEFAQNGGDSTFKYLMSSLEKRDGHSSKDEDGNELSLFGHKQFHVIRGNPNLEVSMIEIGSDVTIGACGDLLIEKARRIGRWWKGKCFTTKEPYLNKAQIYNAKGERLLSFDGHLRQLGNELAAKVGPAQDTNVYLRTHEFRGNDVQLFDSYYASDEDKKRCRFLLVKKE